MIKIYNVGQGDAFLLKPSSCIFENDPLLIDCGSAKAQVYKKISVPISKVLITHSHDDHLSGLEDILKHNDITDLYIPYYLTEIQSIEQYLNKKISKRSKPLPMSKLKNIKLYLLKDGDKLCEHSEILNPPIQQNFYFDDWLEQNNNINIKIALQNLNALGFELPIDEILNYTSPLIIKELDIHTNDRDYLREYVQNARQFVQNFFKTLYIRIMMTTPSSIELNTVTHMLLTSNQASIVLKYDNVDSSYLFTGDADISVFERILSTKNGEYKLKADILKIPHHGSCENMTERILRIINPRVVLISHGNRYDHPSNMVMSWFKKLGIDDYYTNDVIKNGACLATKTIGRCVNDEVEFVN